ncbi:MAG: error-prone DNA polymerase [Planctomycetota bacterium]
MPDRPPGSKFDHPIRSAHAPTRDVPRVVARRTDYAELWTTSCFSFLRGASKPEELVHRAKELGYRAISICDRATLAGAVRAHVAAREAGIALAVGARVDARAGTPADAASDAAPPPLPLYPQDVASHGRLCRLLSRGKLRASKGDCDLALSDVLEFAQGLIAIALPPEPDDPRGPARALHDFERGLAALRPAFDERHLFVAAAAHAGPDDAGHLARVVRSAARAGLELVAAGDARMHDAAKKPLLDALSCVREGTTVAAAGHRLLANAERRLAPLDLVARRFAGLEHALRRSVDIAERAGAFSLDQLDFRYPSEVRGTGRTAMEELVFRTEEGARERYPKGVPEKVRRLVEHEFALIAELRYAPYFLTVWDLVRFARERRILCQGRGAAANSAVCYCLGVTAVVPERSQLLFERFVSKERGEPPDIDVDFEHERREEVIQYLYRRYGRERAALTAAISSYRGRGALRDAGKVLGISPETIDVLAKGFDHWGELDEPERRIRDLGFDPRDESLVWLVKLANELRGLPRHLSQHVGGFVITEAPLCELTPIANAAMEDRTTIEWDKDDLDAMGILKVDVLALGMLTCVRKCFDLVRTADEASIDAGTRYDLPRDLTLSTIPAEDEGVYGMIQRADTIGVFQIESRAQMSMLPRLRPACFYDLVIEVAIVRPGPIQGDMVHPYLRRRTGEEPVDYPSEAVRGVLERTLGVPIFQEQAMALSVVAAGFTPSESDQLRRAMGSWRRDGRKLAELGAKLVAGLLERGYPEDYAQRLLKQVHGFGDYGFPESHAASFALIVYVSAWLKHHHPAAFAAALLNSQPMGFYAPSQIVRDAREHGVPVRPICVNASRFDCTLEPGGASARGVGAFALRLGMRQVKGVAREEGDRIAHAVAEHGRFDSIESLWRASGVNVGTLRKLARAGAFASFGLEREDALWQVRALKPRDAAFEDGALPFEPQGSTAELPRPDALRRVLADYGSAGLSLRGHPLQFLREELDRRGAVRAVDLRDAEKLPHGKRAKVAGLVLVRQRPGTASGILFVTLEDETGTANLIVRPRIFERDRRAARHAVALLAEGTIERQGEVVHLMVSRLTSVDESLRGLGSASRDFQ